MTKIDIIKKVENIIDIKGVSSNSVSVIEILDVFLDENVSY